MNSRHYCLLAINYFQPSDTDRTGDIHGHIKHISYFSTFPVRSDLVVEQPAEWRMPHRDLVSGHACSVGADRHCHRRCHRRQCSAAPAVLVRCCFPSKVVLLLVPETAVLSDFSLDHHQLSLLSAHSTRIRNALPQIKCCQHDSTLTKILCWFFYEWYNIPIAE